MGRQLAYAVVVNGPDGEPVTITPDKQVPDWAAKQIGDHAYVTDDEAADDGPPPKTGKGSAKEAWVTYADTLGVEVDADATRDDIIAAIAEAGHPVE